MNQIKSGLFQSVMCTAIFAVVFGIVVSCGGGRTELGPSLGPSLMGRLITRSHPSMSVLPGLQGNMRVIASFFQTTSGTPQLTQSFQGDATPSFDVQQSTQTTGFIAIGSNESHYEGIFAAIGDSTDTSGKAAPIVGFPVFENGTISTLVVSGLTINNARIRCTDLTDTAAVTDGQLVEPWLDIASGSITLAIGSTRLSLTCSLNTAASNIQFLTVYWTKT